MAPTKLQAEPQTKAAPATTIDNQPALPEKRNGPVRPGRLQRAAGTLRPPNGTPPTVRTGEMLASPDRRFGAPMRARMAGAMQSTVGNTRMSKMLAGKSGRQADNLQMSRMPSHKTITPTASASVTATSQSSRSHSSIQPTKLARKPFVQRKCTCGGDAGPDGECSACKAKREAIQRQASGPVQADHIPTSVTNALQEGGGQQINSSTREPLEQSFGTDFSGVRVHADRQADLAAKDIQAAAFTHGQNIYFAEGQYQPHTIQGKKLLAHELTHTIQQGKVGQAQLEKKDRSVISKPDDPLEKEAESLANQTGSTRMSGDQDAAIKRRTLSSSPMLFLQRDRDAGVSEPSAGSQDAGTQSPTAPSPREAVQYQGRTLTLSPSQVREQLWPIFMSGSARGLNDFIHGFSDSITWDQESIRQMRREAESQPESRRQAELYPGDVSGVPWSEEEVANLETRIAEIQNTIAFKQRILPVMQAQATRILNEPTISQPDLALIDRLQGRDRLYQLLLNYREADNNLRMARSLRSSARDPGQAEESISYLVDRSRQARVALDGELHAQGFANLEEFNARIRDFENFFQRYALQTAFAMLSENERLVRAEQMRYGAAPEVDASAPNLHHELQPLRPLIDQAEDKRQQAARARDALIMIDPTTPLRLDMEANQLEERARRRVRELAATYPILADERISLSRLVHADESSLRRMLQNTAQYRLEKIRDAREHLTDDPETVWQAEGVMTRARQSLNIRQGSIFDHIINDKLASIRSDQVLRDLFLGALALGFGLLTGGTGAVAFVGAVGVAGTSIATAAIHTQDYLRQSAFAGSHFDRAQSLSANEPELLWLALDIVGAALDLGAAARAFRELGPIARRAVATAGEVRVAATTAAETELSQAGNHIQPGLGDRLAASAERAHTDAGFLETTRTATERLTTSQISHELEIAQRSGQRRLLTDGEYIEEIVLPNGHTWRRSQRGHWCRFSDPLCFLLGESGEVAAVREVGYSTAGIRNAESDAARTELRGNLGSAPFGEAQAHHIIPWEMRSHPLVDEMMRNHGWNINGTMNGIHLPTRPNIPGAGSRTVHMGSHQWYTSMVEARIEQLYQQWRHGQVPDHQLMQRFTDIIDDFRNRLITGMLSPQRLR